MSDYKKYSEFEYGEIVEAEQMYNNKTIRFDCDSSPKAWKHYKEYYSDTLNALEELNYNFDEPRFYDYINYGNYSYYVDEPLCDNNRLVALPKGTKSYQNGVYEKPVQRIGGDTDFNFQRKVYNKLLPIIYHNLKDNREEYEARKAQLDNCRSMQHHILNFSVMPVMGNLQQFKSRGLPLNHNDYEWLDRPDTLIYCLNDYFCNTESSELNKYLKYENYSGNSEALETYLSAFKKDIYLYCEKIYFIENRELVNALIENGNKPIKTIDDVVRYMNLADRFWQNKETYFKTPQIKSS